jgi:hypothetical protein
MKILYINHPESDYGGAFLYNGLCCEIGSENVYDYPAKWSYHGRTHHYSIQNIPNGMTAPLQWMRNWPSPYEVEDEAHIRDTVVNMVNNKEFDLVVIESPRRVALQTYRELQDRIRIAGIPLIVHDGEDYPDFCKDFLEFGAKAYLKRELRKSQHGSEETMAGSTRVLSFPFSCPFEEITSISGTVDGMKRDQTDYEVFFACGNTSQKRVEMAECIRRNTDINSYTAVSPDPVPDHPQGLLAWEGYINTMVRSGMCVSVEGHGIDTARFWEIPALSPIAFCNGLDLHIPNQFRGGIDCIRFSDPNDLCDKIRHYREDSDSLEAIAHAGHAHLKEFHTNRARAKQLLEVANG